jgi:hypothetical protein
MNKIGDNKNNKADDYISRINLSKAIETYEDMSDNSSKDNHERYKNGRWQPAEHLRFIKGCLIHGNNWNKVRLCLLFNV